jgi:hypothetical protein
MQAALATLVLAPGAAGASTADYVVTPGPVVPELPAGLARAGSGPEVSRLAQAAPARRPGTAPPARSAPRPPGGAYNVDADHETVLERTSNGQIQPLGQLMPKAQKVGRGELIGVEPDIERATYRFKYVRPGGSVVWVDMDGRTGKVIDVKD